MPGLEVRGCFEQGQGLFEDTNSQYYPMNGYTGAWNYWNPPADVWLDTGLPTSKLLHHKYMVIDANSYSDPIVITGSHNWSYSADAYNDEHTLMIHDRLVSNLYLQEFAERYHESGGTDPLGELTAVDAEFGNGAAHGSILLHANVPNPFNPSTRISFENRAPARMSLRIYDTTGRLVRTLVDNDPMPAGLHVVGWDGKNNDGLPVASGVYLCRLDGGRESRSMKMLLLK